MHGTTADGLGGVGEGEGESPFQEAAKEEVKGVAVVLDVGFQLGQHILVVFLGTVIHVPHIGGVQFQDTEACVKIFDAVLVFVFLLDFHSSTADALFADFTDVFVTGLICIGFCITRFC